MNFKVNDMKNLVNEELRSMFTPFKVMPFLASRNWGIRMMNSMGGLYNGKKIKGLHNEERYIPSKAGGPDIRIRIFKPLNAHEKLPCLEYIHGGGYILGSPEFTPNLDIIKQFIDKRPCVVIAPAYRKSLDAPYPAAFNDCYDTLLWAKENADELGILNHKFMVAGHSGGEMTSVPVWNTKSNKKGWDSYLKDIRDKNEEVPVYAAAARNKDYRNFPPTITFVGDLEPFKDETIAYVKALEKEGVEVKFRLFKGCYHGFDAYVPKSQIAKDAVRFTYDSYAEYYDKYVNFYLTPTSGPVLYFFIAQCFFALGDYPTRSAPTDSTPPALTALSHLHHYLTTL